jgi:transposase
MKWLPQISKGLPERYYVGIDIGYREHVAAGIALSTFMQGEERWKKAKAIHFSSSHSGFEQLRKYLDGFRSDPQAFLIVLEPTGGYYGASLYQALLESHYSALLVDNSTTRHMREKIFGNIPKTDEMDGRTMARIAYLHDIVGEEFALKPLQVLNADQEELLLLCRNSWKLNMTITRARNQFAQLIAVIFPELKFFFGGSVSSIVPVRLMAQYSSPSQIASAKPDELYQVLWKARGYQHAKRMQELQNLARSSSGILPDPGPAWRLTWLTQFLLTNFELLAQLDKQIENLCTNHPNYHLLVGIPYAGPNTLRTILAATGEHTRFKNYRQYVAYTGYFAGLERSQTIDHTRMSRRGNRNLKRAYFQIVAPMVWFDPGDNSYKNLYKRKMAEGRAWYEAMPFACAALTRHVYHCLKFQEPYQLEKAFGRALSLSALGQTKTAIQADLEEQFETMDAQLSQKDSL